MANINPNDQSALVAVERKRKLADALRKQSTTPQGQMVSGFYVNPNIAQYLASALGGYKANKLENESADLEQKTYQDRANLQRDAAQRYAEALRGKQVQTGEQKLPFEPTQMDRFGSPMQGQVQATKPIMQMQQPSPQDILNAQLQYGQDTGNQELLLGAGNARLNYDINQQTREDAQAARAAEGEAQRLQRMQELKMRLEDSRLSRQDRADLMRELQQGRLDSQKMIASLKSPAQGANGQPNIDWKYDAGSDEFVAPPKTEFPQGRRSGNIAKSNAAQSMQYVIDQFSDQKDAKGRPIKGSGALSRTAQGGIMGATGIIGGMTDSQDQKRFNNLKEQLSTELRTLFRIPGEGALSDKEQAQYGVQLPDVRNSREINESILRDIGARVKLRQNNSTNPLANQGGAVDFGDLK